MFRLIVSVLWVANLAYAFCPQLDCCRTTPFRSLIMTRVHAATTSIAEASDLLIEWDQNTNPEQTASKSDGFDMDTARPKLANAVKFLNQQATNERNQDSTTGRAMLGICASNTQEGLATLKAWVTALDLPRGLLHGMDKDGVVIDMDGGVYIKYNSGGVFTFSEIRKAGLGFDAIWKPGDALCEPYDGDYRGVYFQVELSDGEFRQYLLPLDTFSTPSPE